MDYSCVWTRRVSDLLCYLRTPPNGAVRVASPLRRPTPRLLLLVLTLCTSDSLSRQFGKAFDDVALYNSSQAGGELPKNFRFARIDYGTETVLPTRWWMWK